MGCVLSVSLLTLFNVIASTLTSFPISAITLGGIIAASVAVVLLLLFPFYLRRRRRKRRSKRASDPENRGFLLASHERGGHGSVSFYPSARIAVVLMIGRKVVHKPFNRFTPKKFESRASYLPALLRVQSCRPCQPSDAANLTCVRRKERKGTPSSSSPTPLTTACTTSRTRGKARGLLHCGEMEDHQTDGK